MANSTEDYPHPFVLDGLHFSEDMGAISFDEYLFDLKIDIADEIQSIYLKKFGFYPNKFWYTNAGYKSMPTDNFPQLQRRPNIL